MTRYLDDSTYATLPGKLSVSWEKVRALEPAVLGTGTYECSPTCDTKHPVAQQRERMVEHLEHGCAGAAVVVSLEPLVVAAYASDLDGVALLRFPPEFVARYQLAIGTRLLAIMLFGRCESKTGQLLYAVDVIPGPRKSQNRWTNYEPLIAEFVSDDTELIEQRKREVDEWEWPRAVECANLRIQRLGLGSARPGIPSRAGWPVRTGGRAYYQPLAAFDAPRANAAAVDAEASTSVSPWVVMFALAALAAVVWLIVAG